MPVLILASLAPFPQLYCHFAIWALGAHPALLVNQGWSSFFHLGDPLGFFLLVPVFSGWPRPPSSVVESLCTARSFLTFIHHAQPGSSMCSPTHPDANFGTVEWATVTHLVGASQFARSLSLIQDGAYPWRRPVTSSVCHRLCEPSPFYTLAGIFASGDSISSPCPFPSQPCPIKCPPR